MLPDQGSAERASLEREAIAIAIGALRRERGDIPNALYATYTAFRLRFLEERGLMDVVPGRQMSSVEALEDARLLEYFVCQHWATVILRAAEEST